MPCFSGDTANQRSSWVWCPELKFTQPLVPRKSEREWALGPGKGLVFLGPPPGCGWPSRPRGLL